MELTQEQIDQITELALSKLESNGMLPGEQLDLIAGKVKRLLQLDSTGVDEVPIVDTIDGVNSLPCVKQAGSVYEIVRVPMSLLQGASKPGVNGKNVYLRSTGTEIQWKLGEDGEWERLILLSDIAGATTLGGLTYVADNVDVPSDTDDLLVRLAGAQEWSVNSNLFAHVTQLMTKVFPFTMVLSGGGTYEKGSVQAINLSWNYDRDIDSQSVNGESLLIGIQAKQYADVTTDETYILSTVCGGQTYTKSVSALFRLKKYYGVSVHDTLTNEQILTLSSFWAQRTQSSTVFDCTGRRYPYYILPTSMASGIQFWIGGLRNTDWVEEIREVTNTYGYIESYTIFRLNSIQTGVLNIEVR